MVPFWGVRLGGRREGYKRLRGDCCGRLREATGSNGGGNGKLREATGSFVAILVQSVSAVAILVQSVLSVAMHVRLVRSVLHVAILVRSVLAVAILVQSVLPAAIADRRDDEMTDSIQMDLAQHWGSSGDAMYNT